MQLQCSSTRISRQCVPRGTSSAVRVNDGWSGIRGSTIAVDFRSMRSSVVEDRAAVGGIVHDLLEVHRRALEQWRGSMNLVGPGDLEEHYADSEAALAGLRPVGRWADLGTGAGF